ncbi:MAG: GntR family transcriptional regulator [Micropruina sp.]|uniref:GntR family transcriptional regulator n=1 Tax=Micropruina sp. TaxID=2737536 RepID=UPI0039E3B89C
MVIKRQTLRAQIREELLKRLKDGTIEAGAGINEAELASELGVSRTPLREALISLETEGYIESEIGKGFRFAVLGSAEFEELAPVIAALECLAIELTPMDRLVELGARLVRLAEDFPESVATHREIIERDEEWHDLLTGSCPNGRLLSLLGSLKGAVHRYEFEIVASDVLIERVAAEHLEIARALVEGDLPRAQAALRVNWINGTTRLIARSRR